MRGQLCEREILCVSRVRKTIFGASLDYLLGYSYVSCLCIMSLTILPLQVHMHSEDFRGYHCISVHQVPLVEDPS